MFILIMDGIELFFVGFRVLMQRSLLRSGVIGRRMPIPLLFTFRRTFLGKNPIGKLADEVDKVKKTSL